MRKVARIGAIAALMSAFIPTAASAHKLNILAQTDGERINGLVYFSGGAGAEGVIVRVAAPDGASLGETTTDKTGAFVFIPAQACDHTFVCESEDGHRAECTVPVAELPPRLRETAPAQAREGIETTSSDADTVALVEQAVARQLQPLREDLARREERARLRDIVGGVGYIIGLMGLAFYFKARARLKGDRRA